MNNIESEIREKWLLISSDSCWSETKCYNIKQVLYFSKVFSNHCYLLDYQHTGYKSLWDLWEFIEKLCTLFVYSLCFHKLWSYPTLNTLTSLEGRTHYPCSPIIRRLRCLWVGNITVPLGALLPLQPFLTFNHLPDSISKLLICSSRFLRAQKLTFPTLCIKFKFVHFSLAASRPPIPTCFQDVRRGGQELCWAHSGRDLAGPVWSPSSLTLNLPTPTNKWKRTINTDHALFSWEPLLKLPLIFCLVYMLLHC